jgi:hypothetical protein
VAEDLDGFEDGDGCPDPDNDADGVLDVDDKCPMLPEDLDGFADEDGCPDPDDDQDGLPDRLDACPREPGPGSVDGCPPAKDAHLPLVLVFDVHDPAGDTNRKSLDRMAHHLAQRFAQRAGYRLIPRDKLHAVLLDEKTNTYRACWDARCQRYLGQRLAAHKTIWLGLKRADQSCSLQAELRDVASGKTDRSASFSGACSPEALVLMAELTADTLSDGP